MRIGVLTTSYPRRGEDAAGAFVAGFSRWLAAHVGEVEVLCADGARPLFYRGGAPAALAKGRWPEAVDFTLRLAAAAARRARRWDAVVSHWLVPSGLVGQLVARGRRHLAIAHGSDVRLLNALPAGAALVRRLARRAELVYVAEALRVTGAPGRVVPMGIEVASLAALAGWRAAARAELGLQGFVVAFLGRLLRDKGCDLLLEALPERTTLLVAGEGPERAALRAQASAYGGRVRLMGQLEGEPKRRLLAAADALAIPSRIDGAPTVALEALAAGLPLVATRVGGLPELLDERCALLTEPAAAPLREALTALRDDPELRARLAAGARAQAAAHDWSVVAPQLWGEPSHARKGCIRTIRV